ncbi:hypothetical protein LSCM1_01913 [Leishmania martiniquensis]|uniref:Uncharacterized protein n=1 Tax=Leishmania martiniquensis TaxID=1580590 RepID=A0A836FWM0_9TRYP|nr:hypothetical protein LSCM1_01913 [Leishmania martiniquensis]
MSNYTVSSSESSSFCTNTAPHSCMHVGDEKHERTCLSASKRTHNRASAGAAADGAFDEEAAGSTYSDSAAKRSLTSVEVAVATVPQESSSMAIRRVPVDYSKRMADLKARSSALERYKMLVRGSRLVEGEQSPPSPAEAKEESRPSPRRDGTQCHALTEPCGCSAVGDTVISDDSETEEEEEPPLPVPQPRRSAAKPASPSDSRRMPQRARSFLSPTPTDRPVARPTEPAGDKIEGDLSDSSRALKVPQMSLPKARCPSSSFEPACTTGGEGDAAVHYVAPELTLPYCASSKRRRDTVRPGYEPVTTHDRPSSQRTSTASFAHTDGPLPISAPQLQPHSHTRRGASASTCRASTAAAAALSSDQPSRRRKSGTVKAALATAATTSAPPQEDADEKSVEDSGVAAATNFTANSPTSHCLAAKIVQNDEKSYALRQMDPEEGVAEGSRVPPAEAARTQEEKVIQLSGSQRAFWLRPSTAMYELTASIAAKRRDHHGDEEERRSTPSRLQQSLSQSCAAHTGTASSCGTPRSCPSIASEAKTRFTTHMTATSRERHGESPAAAASAPPKTYDSIYSARQSTVPKSVSSHPRQRLSIDAASVHRTCDSPHRQPQRRAVPRVCSLRSSLERRHSTLSLLSSDSPVTVSSEECHRAAGTGRVSARQQDSFSKHCARVATRNSLAEDSAGAAAKPMKRPKKRAVVATAGEVPAKDEATAPSKPEVHKKLHFEPEDECVPRTTIPQSTGRVVQATVEPALETSSTKSPIHGSHQPGEGTPSKSRRREHDLTASPARPDDHADAELRLSPQEAPTEPKEGVHAQQTPATPGGCRQARYASMGGAQTSRATGAVTTSTNEVVAAMLQGIVQQTRQTLPCFLCADQQATSAYRVHVDRCRPKAEALLREYYAAIEDVKEVPAALQERIQHMASQQVPSATSPETVRDAFVRECYQCVKAMLVACRKCCVRVRIQDVKEHEMLCGRACYLSSRAAERVRATVERIEHGSQEGCAAANAKTVRTSS